MQTNVVENSSAVQDPFDEERDVVLSPKEQGVEVAVFLFLVVPSMVLSLFAIRQGQVGFPLTATAVILRDLGLVCLILFFLWRNGEPRTRLGWNWRHPVREGILGLLLFVPFTFATALLDRALLSAGLSAPATQLPAGLEAKGPTEILLALLLVTVVAVSEETIFRGYLLLRFPTVLGNMASSVLFASVIFAVGHGYEGSAGVVTVGTMGAVFALVYLWRGSLVAPIVMHFLQDFLGIVLLPLLTMK